MRPIPVLATPWRRRLLGVGLVVLLIGISLGALISAAHQTFSVAPTQTALARQRLGLIGPAPTGIAPLELAPPDVGSTPPPTGGVPPLIIPAPPDVPDDQVPLLGDQPVPPLNTFHDCPSTGSGGDRLLNIRKNRTDSSGWYRVTLTALLTLAVPDGVARRDRATWPAPAATAVAQAEGLPIQVEGWLIGVRQENIESTNCNSVADLDYHLWLAAGPTPDRAQALVAEITPRVRALHPEWSLDRLRPLATTPSRVRLSSWLLLDQEHPEQLGQTRATLWEIHPILAIDTWQGEQWLPLGATPGASLPTPMPTTVPVAPRPAPAGLYMVSAAVSHERPTKNTHVTITGTLQMAGQPVIGATMEATWHYRTTTSYCEGQTDGQGVARCTRDISQATAGYTVIVDLLFTTPEGYQIATTTSFTPR